MPTKTSYVPGNFKLAVRRSRTGLGLFALEPIPKGACIIEYTGKVLTDAQYERTKSRYLFDIGRGKVLDGSARSNRARYINHSCAPNCEPTLHKRRPFIHAIRDIAPGEELAYNYGEEYFDAFLKGKCLCPKCRAEREQAAAAVEPASEEGREAA